MAIDILTPLKKKLNIYSDFRKDLDVNPISNDLALKLDEEAVKESLKNLILTNRGERLFQPNIGGDVKNALFDLMTPVSLKLIEQDVKNTISNYEPRATIINVNVVPYYDQNSISVNILFYVRNSQTPVSVTVFLERTR